MGNIGNIPGTTALGNPTEQLGYNPYQAIMAAQQQGGGNVQPIGLPTDLLGGGAAAQPNTGGINLGLGNIPGGYYNAPGGGTFGNYANINPMVRPELEPLLQSGYAQNYVDPNGAMQTYATQKGLDSAGDLVFNMFEQLSGGNPTGEMVGAANEFMKMQYDAYIANRPINATDMLSFVDRQFKQIEKQYKTATKLVDSSAAAVQGVSDVVSSARDRATKAGEKISQNLAKSGGGGGGMGG